MNERVIFWLVIMVIAAIMAMLEANAGAPPFSDSTTTVDNERNDR